MKRIQEGLRSIEEIIRLTNNECLARQYERYRYLSYTYEKEVQKLLWIDSKKHMLDTDLYCITAEGHSLGRNNIEVIKIMIDAGIKIIQYREKEKKPGEIYEQCKVIRDMTREKGVVFIVNDYIDIALLVKADGVHIGQDDLPIKSARRLVGEQNDIGVSTHSPSQAIQAQESGADYIGVGPIFKTSTKKDVCEPIGLECLEYIVKNISIPFVAIGGIKQHNISNVRQQELNDCISNRNSRS